MRLMAIGLVAALAFPASAIASEPFTVVDQTTSGAPQSVTVTGNNLPNLVSHLIQSQQGFDSLQNRDTSASISYGRIPQAIILTRNAAGTSATLKLPTIGFSKTFSAANEEKLQSQIKDFAKRNGSTIYGAFIRSINERTDIGVTDGNPLAATALLADQQFWQFGLDPSPYRPGAGIIDPLDQVATPDLRLDLHGGYAHTDHETSTYGGGAITGGVRFSDSVGLAFATPFNYRNVSGADVWHIGEEISLPVVLVKPRGDRSLSWLVAPTFIAGASGSIGLASGGTFLGGGATSSLSFQLDSFVFTVADSWDYFHGFPLRIGPYRFDTNIDQQIVKNGLKITRYFGDSLFIDGGASYTDFIGRSAVNVYWTPTVGIGLRLNEHAGFHIGYTGDFGHDFAAHGGEMQWYWNF